MPVLPTKNASTFIIPNLAPEVCRTPSGKDVVSMPVGAAPTTKPSTSLKKVNLHAWATFVRPSVKTIPLTKQIIDAIMPYFPLKCKVIGGYLNSADQYWKVNYHWENLVTKIEDFRGRSDVEEKHKNMALAVWKVLMTNPPLPERGYIKDKNVGDTQDLSANEKIEARHKLLKQSKLDFRAIIIAAGIVDPKKEKSDPPAAEKPWWLAVAPLAKPGHSLHGTGYALDISGDNVETTKLAKALGCTLAFNEASHVHVEFAKGVNVPISA
jgi:hypothetical protein